MQSRATRSFVARAHLLSALQPPAENLVHSSQFTNTSITGLRDHSTTGPESPSVFVTPLELQPVRLSPCPGSICRPVPEKEVQSV